MFSGYIPLQNLSENINGYALVTEICLYIEYHFWKYFLD